MFNILAISFMTATRSDRGRDHRNRAHWPQSERFDTRERAQIEAHTHGRLRD